MLFSYCYKNNFGILLIIQVSGKKIHMRVEVLEAILVCVASQDSINFFLYIETNTPPPQFTIISR